jgi:uncharacterized membrane protein YdbT with pleckstrin-like domain
MEEKKIWSGTSSLMLNLGVFLLCGLVFLLLLFLMVKLWDWLAEMGTMALIPAFVILLSPLAYALAKALLVKSVKYEISSERIKITTGIFSKQTNALELYRIKDYFLNEPFFFRLFHLGNIVVLTSDQSTPQIVMRAIRGAKPLMDELRTNVEMRRDAKKVREVDFGPTGDPGDPSS